MIRIKHRFVLLSAMTLLACLAACSDSSKTSAPASALIDEDGILKYVPADTPYLMATPGDLPDDVVDILEPQLDVVLHAYHKLMLGIIDAQMAEAAADESETEDEGETESDAGNIEEYMPIIDELGSLMSVEGLRASGINRDSDVAFYGMGLLPGRLRNERRRN